MELDKTEMWMKRLSIVFSHVDKELSDIQRKELEIAFAEIFSQLTRSCNILLDFKPYDESKISAGTIKRNALDMTTVLLRLYLDLWFNREHGMRQYNEIVKVITEEIFAIEPNDPGYSRYLIDEKYFKLHDEEIDESIFEDK